ncbi:Gfo/Idh/MocA family oxidoreductase [Alcaligenes nematophilus]|uniref:NAD(P)H-dependent oxidoreductase n=1 Tax=Alcaligenes nematophilus TaxID=2994643 RepID=UPI00245DE864|nr:Gfo/Idh/MocA family oxidoreductase [Alcaligenes nematophilus]MDH4868382.1 Gfo/Idh/MocA family oxidoreductase [Bacillus cereus]MDY7129696.1 Gfo/Idh/MocA family oxidoreductase [Alcaligenes nematophilus]
MNFYTQLLARAEQGKPVRVGIIGAGKFASMYFAQVLRTPGVHMVGIADLRPANAHANLKRVGWEEERTQVASLDEAIRCGKTHVGDDWQALVAHPEIEIVIECTGNPIAAVDHCLAAFKHGKHVINVTVEADAFCGPLLAHRAREAGVLYSLAYGDQPGLACELVDWARTCGFPIIAAGRGHKWLPQFRESTPDTVWDHWGVTAEQARIGGMNPKMFNAFLDGSKPAIESTAIANSTGLQVQAEGITFAPASIENIPTVMRLKSDGGVLSAKGVVDVISSLNPDGSSVGYDIRKGVWVCVEAPSEYIQRCFKEYQVFTDPDGRCMVQYKKWHLIGLELGISVASVGLRGEPTGVAQYFNADVVATAKRNLKAGEMLDGEGGYTVFGKLSPAKESLRVGSVPLGLAHNMKLRRDVGKDQSLTWDDVVIDESLSAYRVRKEMEALFQV